MVKAMDWNLKKLENPCGLTRGRAVCRERVSLEDMG